MAEFSEGDKVELVNVWRGGRKLKRMQGKTGVVETIGHGEANEGYYEVQFHAFDGFASPQKLKWILGNRLKKIND